MKEIWKDIKGYEGLYQISNLGRIKRLPTVYLKHSTRWDVMYSESRTEHILKNRPISKRCKYQSISLPDLQNKNRKVYKLVHRLVAQAFIPNPDNLPCVNHKDENKLNNRVDNLEWCTHQYNVNYGTNIERMSMSRKGKCKGKDNYNHIHGICLITRQKISNSLKGRKWMSNGTEFIMVNPEDFNHYLNLGYVFGRKLKEV